jgi:hypothetical protein
MNVLCSLLVVAAVLGCFFDVCDAFSTGSINVAGRSRLSLQSVKSTGSRVNIMDDIVSSVEERTIIRNEVIRGNDKLAFAKRFGALSIALTSCLLTFSSATLAADKGAGTITDKKYELCVSKCVFSETRPPPNGADNERILTTISRTDIIKDCRKSCAKTKEQLFLGKPKIKAAIEQQKQ